MPSSHAAIVCAVTMIVGREYGFDSSAFAMSFIFSLVVMYDAAGVRRAAGKQARVLNQIIESEGKNINIQEKMNKLKTKRVVFLKKYKYKRLSTQLVDSFDKAFDNVISLFIGDNCVHRKSELILVLIES